MDPMHERKPLVFRQAEPLARHPAKVRLSLGLLRSCGGRFGLGKAFVTRNPARVFRLVGHLRRAGFAERPQWIDDVVHCLPRSGTRRALLWTFARSAASRASSFASAAWSFLASSKTVALTGHLQLCEGSAARGTWRAGGKLG